MERTTQAELSSPRRTKEVLGQFGFTVKKSLGQNFLTDGNILNRIVAAAELDPDTGVLEIGPGLGALTERLAQAAAVVAAIEIDSRLIPILAHTLRPYRNVHVVQGDVLKLDLRELWRNYFHEDQRVSVVANLPYYITTPILMKLLEERLPLHNIVVMIQREVAERLAAKPGTKQYGSLSIAVQYYCEPELIAVVPHTVFVPQPNVDSAVIKLNRREVPPVRVDDEAFFFAVVQACFAQRRKTIANNLLSSRFWSKENGGRERLERALGEAGIDPARRGETLSISEYALLTQTIRAFT